MGKRPKMLASVVREVVAPFLLRCPEQCGIVSITEVKVSSDFSNATVYISALKKPELALEFLERIGHEIRTAMGSIYRKRIPDLLFKIDPLISKGNAIDALLK